MGSAVSEDGTSCVVKTKTSPPYTMDTCCHVLQSAPSVCMNRDKGREQRQNWNDVNMRARISWYFYQYKHNKPTKVERVKQLRTFFRDKKVK